MFIIGVGEFATEITKEEMTGQVFDIDFGGHLKVQITKTENGFKVTNAMNGYGQNCKKEYENKEVHFYEQPLTK